MLRPDPFMKRLYWYFLAGICVVGVLFICLHWLQLEYVNANRAAIYNDMNEIRKAVLIFSQTNGSSPNSLDQLVPSLLSNKIIERSASYDLTRRKVLVPANPYGLRKANDGFEITCKFYGNHYSQVVMTSKGEVNVE